jgi:mRNA-degrading endonuclease toxin of MazEF toxin-antitoxin module
MSSPSQGRIVWVELIDPQGHGPKSRPAVILTPTAEIAPGGSVTVAAISTRSVNPAREVALPWQRDGKARTLLRSESFAVADWLAIVPLGSIQGYAGVVPPRELSQLILLGQTPPE